MRSADRARLLALAAIRGSSFAFMRALAPAIGPFVTAPSVGCSLPSGSGERL